MLSRFPSLAALVFVRRLVVGLVTAYVCTSLLLGGTPAARPVFRALAAAWALLLSWHAWRSRRRSAAPGPSWRRAEVVVTNVALALLLGELGLRAYGLARGDSFLVRATLDACRLVPGRDYGHGLRGNALGYPGADFSLERRPGVRRIAALGDSFAVGPAVPFADNYLTLVEGLLPDTEVYNFGVSGAGPREYRQILRHDVWPFRPDLVLVSVFVGNDVTEELATPHQMDPRQHALYLLGQRGLKLLRERARQGRAPGGEDRLAWPPLSAETFREVESRRLAVCLRPVPAGVEKKWRQALAHLDALVADCGERGVPVRLVLIPDEFQVNPHVRAEAAAAAGVGADEVDVELPQRRLRAFCAERGVACLDLLPMLAGVADAYAPLDTHWNARGNRLAAQAICRWLDKE